MVHIKPCLFNPGQPYVLRFIHVLHTLWRLIKFIFFFFFLLMQVLNFALNGPHQIIATVEMRLKLEEEGVKSGENRQYQNTQAWKRMAFTIVSP